MYSLYRKISFIFNIGFYNLEEFLVHIHDAKTIWKKTTTIPIDFYWKFCQLIFEINIQNFKVFFVNVSIIQSNYSATNHSISNTEFAATNYNEILDKEHIEKIPMRDPMK